MSHKKPILSVRSLSFAPLLVDFSGSQVRLSSAHLAVEQSNDVSVVGVGVASMQFEAAPTRSRELREVLRGDSPGMSSFPLSTPHRNQARQYQGRPSPFSAPLVVDVLIFDKGSRFNRPRFGLRSEKSLSQ